MASAPADATRDRYVITLFTSDVPMAIRIAPALQIAGLSVFRSPSVEDGEVRFRLHIGYFATHESAEQVLEQVRPHYPEAFVSDMPIVVSGSLDDTLNTSFSLVRHAIARLVTADDVAEPTPPAGAPVTTLTPSQVARVMAPQRYAVQLVWSVAPVPASIPRLGIFRAYSVYALSVVREGRTEHGLRLGFFKSLDSARQVAEYVRHAYPYASVVPVSYREFVRASELTRVETTVAQPRADGAEPAAETGDRALSGFTNGATAASTAHHGLDREPLEPGTQDEIHAAPGSAAFDLDRQGDAVATIEDGPQMSRRARRVVRRS